MRVPRRLAKTEKLVAEVVDRLPEMPAPLLAALAVVVIDEIERRSASRDTDDERREGR